MFCRKECLLHVELDLGSRNLGKRCAIWAPGAVISEQLKGEKTEEQL
jgi:hypothetical protein